MALDSELRWRHYARRMRSYLIGLMLTGCGFSVTGGASPSGDGGVDAPSTIDAPPSLIDAPMTIDAPPVTPPGPQVAHLSAADELPLNSTVDYTLGSGTITVDTTAGTIMPAPPAGVVVRMAQQEGGGLALLVVQARNLRVPVGSILRVTGTRGLVLVATAELRIEGLLDASASGGTPGAGGYPASNGPGEGGDGIAAGGNYDTGAAGGSFGTRGGAGGPTSANVTAGPNGANPYGAAMLPMLFGGSGGGNSSPATCGAGGAGGGAVQLTAPTVVISGGVRANGGGGQGGRECLNGEAGSGAGGGSGGAIFVEATVLDGAGGVYATGGGGGGGGCASCIGSGQGGNGDNGRSDGFVASGGSSPLSFPLGEGGDGALAGNGQNGNEGGNAGGGGGGAGRIVYAIPANETVMLTSVPTAVR